MRIKIRSLSSISRFLRRRNSYLAAKYNLLSIPVVDEKGVHAGHCHTDDALDTVLPTAYKKRLPRFF